VAEKTYLPAVLTEMKSEAATVIAINSQVRRNLWGFALFFGIFGFWGTFATITGAVIAPGFVIVESNVRNVQHPTGGIVERIAVKDGSRVKAGDLLVRLDETQAKAQLQILVTQIDELLVRQARLDAERTGASVLLLPENIASRSAEPALGRIIALEKVVLESRQQAFVGQLSQLEERINQTNQEIEGVQGQLLARRQQVELVTKELGDLEPLFERKLVSLQRISGLRRESSRLQGDVGSLVSEVAKARAKVAETQLQIIQSEQQRRSDLTQEARDIASKLAESLEKRIVLEDQLNRIDIRSPSDGTVHQLAVFTIGGVVRAGETVLKIVPSEEELTLEVRIQPRDIDQVKISQPATIRLAAASQAITQSIDGQLFAISPDIVFDAASQQRYFVGRVKVTPGALEQKGIPKLQPGMPADVFIRTDERSPVSYLFRPLIDQANRAFRER
jgi:HlyD family secretion protein